MLFWEKIFVKAVAIIYYKSLKSVFGPGVEIDENNDEQEDGAEGWKGHREGLFLVLLKLLLSLLLLTSGFFGFSFQLPHYFVDT